jgi:type III secretion protein S
MIPEVMQLVREALWLVLALSAPPIIAATVVGLLVAFVQSVTQLQEQTLSFTLKLIAVSLALLLSASLIGASLSNFADQLFTNFPMMVRP